MAEGGGSAGFSNVDRAGDAMQVHRRVPEAVLVIGHVTDIVNPVFYPPVARHSS